MAKGYKQIAVSDAEAMLHAEPSLHVVLVHHDGPARYDEARWPKSRVSELLRKHGAFLAGPNAREANHGICTELDDSTSVFIETKHH